MTTAKEKKHKADQCKGPPRCIYCVELSPLCPSCGGWRLDLEGYDFGSDKDVADNNYRGTPLKCRDCGMEGELD